jgi:hypothetical protein
MTISELIPVLQMAVGPVVLITGVGLLIGSLTSRLGRVVDRGRILNNELHGPPELIRTVTKQQIKILIRRAQLLERAITLAVLCDLSVAILIIALFFIAALKIEAAWLVGGLFLATIGSLVLSLVSFLQELNLGLKVFMLDLKA